MRKASLFSGIGGIDLAAHWAGMETVVFCEREPFPQSVLQNHWPDVPIIEDVHDFTRKELDRRGIGTIDIVSAGYPCQPFSYAGKRDGTNDDRHLWPEVKRILEEIRPRWFVGENVAGHITLGLDIVLADLADIGYTAQAFVIPASAVYAVHQRKRVFIVGYTDQQHGDDGGHGTGEICWERETPELQGSGSHVADTSCELPYGTRGERRRRNEHSDGGHELADTTGERCGEGRGDRGRSEEWPSGSCEALADADGARREECDSPAVADRSGYGSGSGDEGNGDVADPDRITRLETNPAFSAIGSERDAWDDAGWSSRTLQPGYRGRASQPGLGRSPDELSAWMDGRGLNPLDALSDLISSYPQPAPRGSPQFDWEPPRVEIGIKKRAPRLKALGNAVNPLQIFPILSAIYLIDAYWNSRNEN